MTHMKAARLVTLRVVALTAIMFVCFAGAGAALGLENSSQGPAEAREAAAALLAVCLLNAIVLTYLILRSRWTGWRLMAAVFVVFYGVMTFMSQIESAVFITRLPAGVLPKLFLMGALIAAPFSVVAVLILGKHRIRPTDTPGSARLVMPNSELGWKLAVIALSYVTLYFTFGYFIAWQDPAVREYYSGVDEGSFLAHMGSVLRDSPWLVPFQIVRGMLWAVLALPIVWMLKGRRVEAAAAVGLAFAVLMNAQALLPNPYMPEAVRMAHLIETASSNFIFGLLAGALLATPRATSFGNVCVQHPSRDDR
jgi:hypothetical protein